MRAILYLAAALLILPAAATALADEIPAGLRDDVLKIIRTRYPDAELRPAGDGREGLMFAERMRPFTIYMLDKTGNWQKPMDAQGPDRGGLFVLFSVKTGRWEGALVVPYTGTTDYHVFRETHVIKDAADGTRHIWAMILTPKVDAPEDVKNALVTVFSEFEKYGK